MGIDESDPQGARHEAAHCPLHRHVALAMPARAEGDRLSLHRDSRNCRTWRPAPGKTLFDGPRRWRRGPGHGRGDGRNGEAGVAPPAKTSAGSSASVPTAPDDSMADARAVPAGALRVRLRRNPLPAARTQSMLKASAAGAEKHRHDRRPHRRRRQRCLQPRGAAIRARAGGSLGAWSLRTPEDSRLRQDPGRSSSDPNAAVRRARAVPRLLNARSRIPTAVPWPRRGGRTPPSPACRRAAADNGMRSPVEGFTPCWNTASLATPVRIHSSRRTFLPRCMCSSARLPCPHAGPWTVNCSPSPRATPRRLLIGNGRYPEIPLNNPEHDALIAQTLRSLDFEGRVPQSHGRDFAAAGIRASHGPHDPGRVGLLDLRTAGATTCCRSTSRCATRPKCATRPSTCRRRCSRMSTGASTRPHHRRLRRSFAARGRASRNANGLAEMVLVPSSLSPPRWCRRGRPGRRQQQDHTCHLATELRTTGVEVEEMMKAVRVKVLRDTAQCQIPRQVSNCLIS